MAADDVVSLATDHQVLAVGGRYYRRRGIHLLRRILPAQFSEDHGHQHAFPNAMDLLLWRIGEHVGAELFGLVDCMPQRPMAMNGVGVGEEQPLPLRDFRSTMHGMVFAGPSCWKVGGVHDLSACVMLGD